MPNEIYNQMHQSSDGGFGAMLQQFNQFRQQFQGDPRAEINKLLQSGRITQAQLDQAQQMAWRPSMIMPDMPSSA